MDNGYISKKDLLLEMGITYGQLYRWKRKNLIPEDWFIKKSSFTGQETYFPKEKILPRIQKILDLKDDLSLDDIAETLSPTIAQIKLTKEILLERNIVTKDVFALCEPFFATKKELSFFDILSMYVFESVLKSNEVSLAESKEMLHFLSQHYEQITNEQLELLFVRQLGVGFWLLKKENEAVYMQSGAKRVIQLSLSRSIEFIKTILT
jgi:DNA-binding transcriptional MerR regulator